MNHPAACGGVVRFLFLPEAFNLVFLIEQNLRIFQEILELIVLLFRRILEVIEGGGRTESLFRLCSHMPKRCYQMARY